MFVCKCKEKQANKQIASVEEKHLKIAHNEFLASWAFKGEVLSGDHGELCAWIEGHTRGRFLLL